jgi:signal recognition particle-docking protein FtsY
LLFVARMYFRTKSIKGSQLVQLVHSYRNSDGLPRQRVIASLGDAKLPEAKKSLIASAVERRIHGEGDFFDSSLSPEASAWVDRIVQLAGRSQAARPVPQATVDGVILDSIETTDVVELGPELVALKAWEELRFTPMLEALGMNPSAIATAQLMVSNRLIEPLSEWALIDWSHRTALPELLDIRITKSAKDRLYRTSDDLMALRKDIESTLLRADVGVQATDRVLEALRQRLNQEVVDPAEGLRFLKEQLRAILEEPITASGRDLLAPEKDRLNVWLLVGVNGVGKTTTLGKLANLAVRSGYSCLIAAADTFRAAAVQQVSVWGERSGVPVVSNPSANADPAAVVYDAIGAAKAKGTELVLVDTAGRLQTKHNLMEELSKVRRIVDKLAPEAVVESLLVLDASQGQNGLRQAMAFASAAGLTGVVLTKLDGSARGGVALAVASEARLPIRFIGAGETIRDLRPFNSFEFVEALLAG